MPILKLLEQFKTSTIHMAIVLDEYGTFEGIVTPTDILVSIAGDLPETADDESPWATKREDGAWLLDGRMPIEEAERTLKIARLHEGEEDYTTLAGFVVARFGHLPEEGEAVAWEGWRFEVVGLDGHRVDKVLAKPPTSHEH